MLTSAGLLALSFVLLVVVARDGGPKPPGPLGVVLLGGVWFSLADYESALLASQLPWYLVIFFLLVCLYMLSRSPLRTRHLVGAGVVAALASVSAVQGLLLWPVGVLCLWRGRAANRLWRQMLAAWTVAATVTSSAFFWHYDLRRAAGASSGFFALRHPIASVNFFFVCVGNVLPSGDPRSFGWHFALGVVVVVVALAVLALSLHQAPRRHVRPSFPLPGSLIVFGLAFDVLTTFGRVGYGELEALAPRYTMPNLLIVCGIAIFVFSHRTGPEGLEWIPGGLLRALLSVGLGVALCAQVADAATFGLKNGAATHASRLAGAGALDGLHCPPAGRAQAVVARDLFPWPGFERYLVLAQRDRLSVFASGVRRPPCPTATRP
jgi:hypothetical protein